jgi:hypothetical protein
MSQEKPFLAGVYRHYKGHLYLALGVARHTETNEDLVVYVPLYTHKNGGKALQARPLRMWDELVSDEELRDSPLSIDVRSRRRFEYIGDVPLGGH